MSERIDYAAVAPRGVKTLGGVHLYVSQSGLPPELLAIVYLRVSLINGCAYCIDMHWKDLRATGETEQRLYGLDAWEESSYYSDRERAALKWTEAVTVLHPGHVPEDVYEAVKPHFSDKELSDLTIAIATINAWNRIAISSRTPAGHYKPGQFKSAQ